MTAPTRRSVLLTGGLLLLLAVGSYAMYHVGYARGFHDGSGYAVCAYEQGLRALRDAPWPYEDCDAFATQNWAAVMRQIP